VLLREFCAAYKVSRGETRRNVSHSALRNLAKRGELTALLVNSLQFIRISPRAAISLTFGDEILVAQEHQ
jgi:hypothetical protein